VRRATWIVWTAALMAGCGGGNPSLEPATPPSYAPVEPPSDSGRRWSPRVEGIYQALLSDQLGEDRVFAVTFGAHGPYLCEAYALVRQPGGAFQVVRAGMKLPDESTLEWKAEALPAAEGEALWKQVQALEPTKLEEDLSLARFVRGPGAAHIYFRKGATTHEAEAWAIQALAERKGVGGFQALVAILREAAP
jgi:hypothetical protein